MNSGFAHAPSIPKVPTGVDGLDRVLYGGLLSAGAYLVMGAPGTGKTTLAAQAVCRHAASGGRALYVTVLAESHARMMQHLDAFSFFDRRQVGRSLFFISAFNLLETGKLRGLLTLLGQELRQKKITLLVVDGFVTAESFADSDTHVKKFVHELQSLLSLARCTALLLANPGGAESYPAHTMVDGVIELNDATVGLRAVRYLRVVKFRGSDHLRGRHVFDITRDGVVVRPRLESLPLPAGELPPLAPAREAAGAGKAGRGSILERLVGVGTTAIGNTLLVGPSGSGKTFLGLEQLATAAARGEKGTYWGFSDAEPDLRRGAASLGIDLEGSLASGSLAIRSVLSPELSIDAFAEQVLEDVQRRGVTRVFVDGLRELSAATPHPDRVAPVMAALLLHLRALGVTTTVSGPSDAIRPDGMSFGTPLVAARVDNIFALHYDLVGNDLRRKLVIAKQRGGVAGSSVRDFTIDIDGERRSTQRTGKAKTAKGRSRRRP